MAGEPLENARAEYNSTWLENRIWLVEMPKTPSLPVRTLNPLIFFSVLALSMYCFGVVVEYGLKQRQIGFVFAGGIAFLVPAVLSIPWAIRRNYSGRVKYDRVHGAMPAAPIGARMIAMGRRDDLGPISELVDRTFDPVIIVRTLQIRPLIFVVILVIAIAGALQVYFGLQHPVFHAIQPLAMAIGYAFCQSIASLRPTYYRIVPGRLDIMKFDGWRKKPLSIERINLRNARIHANLGTRLVEISNPLVQKKRIQLATVSEPHRFVQGLFQAAICTTSAPPLPDDELLG